jgi:SAM-dependent methyltransferase
MPSRPKSTPRDIARLKAHWESVGEQYSREWDPPGRAEIGGNEIGFILGGLLASPGRTALDVGIGSGRILAELLRHAPETEFYGVDIAEAMIEASRARLAGELRVRELRVCDVSVEPLPYSETFDFISAIRMLKYNRNWRDIVAKLVAQLNERGVIVFSMTNRNSLNRISREYVVPWDTASARELEDLCAQLGLTVLDVSGFTKLPHQLYLRARSRRVAHLLRRVDWALDRVLGPRMFARELFVAARRG